MHTIAIRFISKNVSLLFVNLIENINNTTVVVRSTFLIDTEIFDKIQSFKLEMFEKLSFISNKILEKCYSFETFT